MGPLLWGSPSPCSCSFPFPRPSPSPRTPRDWSASRRWRRSGDAATKRQVPPAQQPPFPHVGLLGPQSAEASGDPQPPPLRSLHNLFRSEAQVAFSPGRFWTIPDLTAHRRVSWLPPHRQHTTLIYPQPSSPFNFFILASSSQALLFPLSFVPLHLGMLPELPDVGTTPLSTVSLPSSPTPILASSWWRPRTPP